MSKVNKWALVTGATSGIGMATTRLFAEKGYSLLIMGRRKERLEALKKSLLESFSEKIEVRSFVIDLRVRSEIVDFVSQNQSLLSKIDILVNNAGLAKGTEKIQDGLLNDWADMLDTNVSGLLWLTRGLLPYLIQKTNSHIINVGSVAGRWVYPGGAVYCASKFAVRAISEGLRMDLLGTGVRVTNVEPGMVHTEFSEVRLGDKEKADKVYSGMNPLQGIDIAETILWCCERPAHVNIQEVVIYPTDQAAVGQVFRRN